ncbi:MAG TPA: hypothetical protein VFH83_05340 [Spirochaetia bacterium]|nr:hypothetical protein [Spirochaetia bacterium]
MSDALREFESATMTACHDLSGAYERRTAEEAKAALEVAILAALRAARRE